MKLRTCLLTGIGILFLLLSFLPVDPVLVRIANALDSLQARYPQEKVYLQLDKEIYYPGENIWFKGYTVYKNKPTTLSGILYVDLMSKTGDVMERKMLPIYGGASNGNFTLPENMMPGTYRIKAYTAWMKNFDPAFMFHTDIEVVNESSLNFSGDSSIKNADTDYKIQFLPEGGNLITNLTSFIALKAVNSLGIPVNVKGIIVDGTGQQVNSFETFHDGMGKFAITPQKGGKYYAVVNALGNQKKILLPEALPSGVALHIINKQTEDSNSHKIAYYIQKNDTTNEYNKLYLVTQMQNRTVDVQEVDFSPQGRYASVQASGSINTTKFPEGIAQVTLFNGVTGVPLAERLVFISKLHKPYASLEEKSISLQARQKEEFTLKLNEDIGGNYSVAVTDADKVPMNEWQNNIKSNFLLASDIKGAVYNPDWYFKDDNTSTLKALDLVMLTNGWTRFSWKKILNNEFPKLKYYLEKSIVLRGQAFSGNIKKDHFYKDNSIVLFAKAPHDADSLDNMMTVETDSIGRFSLTGLYFHESGTIYVMKYGKASGNEKKRKRKDKEESESILQSDISVIFQKNLADTMPLKSNIELPFLDPELHFKSEQLQIYSAQAKKERFYEQQSIARTIQLKTVTIKAHPLTRTDSLIKEYTSAPFAGISARTYDLTKDKYNSLDFADNALDYISSHVAGPVVDGDTKVSPIIYWRLRNGLMMGVSRATLLLNAPDFFLNEQLLNDGPSGYDNAISRLQMVKVADIAMMRVFPPGFLAMAPGNAPHGAIIIYTRQGSDVQEKTTALDLVHIKGFSVTKEFYSPDYDKLASGLPDMRTTLYWNPYLIPDEKTHSVNFSFYNNDSCKKLRIIVEGMGRDGEMVHLEKLISGN